MRKNNMAIKKVLRKDLTDKLGITERLAGPRCDLAPKSLWKRECEYGTIEKISLQMEEDFTNYIYLCLPKDMPAPYRAFICLQGHSTGMHTSIAVDWHDEVTPIPVEGDRDFAIGCMKRGIAAICLEQRAMGVHSENVNQEPGCLWPSGLNTLLHGRTMVGDRVFDVDRVIDYMAERGDFDMTHVGVMGNSGGGTTSIYAGATLTRLTHVMPSCAFSTYQASIMSIRHCICNYIPGLLELGEVADILSLTAPRNLVLVCGRFDPIFPLADAQKEFERLHAFYEEQGAGGKCHMVIGEGDHRFYADDAWKVMLPLWQE